MAVWIEGPVATRTDTFNDPVIVGLLANGQTLGTLVETLQDLLADVEREQDVTIELRGRTRADVQALDTEMQTRLGTATLLFGVPPSTFFSEAPSQKSSRPTARTHADLDAHALALGRAIGEKLARDPSLLERTRERLVQLLRDAPKAEQRELREWQHILDTTSLPRLRRLLVDPGERATRLRQSLPFLDVLTAEERETVLESTVDTAPASRRRPR
jgi:hypothetical protein